MNKEDFVRERHWQTQSLVDVFAGLKENEVVPYADLARLCKIDEPAVRKRLQSAKKIVLRDHSIIIETVKSIGVCRITQELVTAPVGKAMGRMRSAAKTAHGLIRHGITDFDKLTRETKSTVYMQQAIVGAVMLTTSHSSRRMLKEHADTTNGEIKIGRTLELLR